ncbi:unnamed protein product, partial [Symbiodinium pilosum]
DVGVMMAPGARYENGVTETGHCWSIWNADTQEELGLIHVLTDEMHCLSAALELIAKSPPPLKTLTASLIEAVQSTSPDWRAFVSQQVGEGIVLMRRPYRELSIRSRVTPVKSQYGWSSAPETHCMIYAGHLLGFGDADGSKGQDGKTTILDQDGKPFPAESYIPGLQSICACVIPREQVDKARVLHRLTQYETILASRSRALDPQSPESRHGFRLVERATMEPAVTMTSQGDAEAMRRQLEERGLPTKKRVGNKS